jgi:hypothetical protein
MEDPITGKALLCNSRDPNSLRGSTKTNMINL